jgi:glycosyltransferase involved in cell wall biosynthesis
MRVLHICSGNLYGGVERIQVTLASHRRLCPEMEPHFAVCFDGRLELELRATGTPVHNLGAARIRNPISMLKARSRLRQILSEDKYDAAICHSDWTQAIFGPVVKARAIPLIYWLHGVPSGQHWLERWARLVQPERVICCSEFAAGFLSKLYPDAAHIVLHPPVAAAEEPGDSTWRLRTRRELDTRADAVVIIQVSRLESWKGHRAHLEALASMRETPDWMCWIVGGAQRPAEQSYLRDLRRLVHESGIENRVRFLGERTDVPRLLRAADIFCQPNTGPEPFGVVFIEALLAGLSVITTGSGGGLEIVDSSCGILVPPNNTSALTDALRQLVTYPHIRSRISDAGPARAQTLCAPAQQMSRLANLIQEACAT